MKYKLKINNSKKIIIGVSILLCTIILIIGLSYAYFTQSKNASLENLVATDIKETLVFTDNNEYMLGNFIPVKETDVQLFASKNINHSSNNYTNEDICKYQDNKYACNLYEFTITNTSDVTQKLMFTLKPSINEFSNLYYMLLEGHQKEITTSTNIVKKGTHINGISSNKMADGITLAPNSSKTYTIVYYIKNLEEDQTKEDANKQFYAIVRIDSITSGTYKQTIMDSTCYNYEKITEGEYANTYKLTKFNGINEDGTPVYSCNVTRDNTTGFYTITVPSTLKNNNNEQLEISTLGNNLFLGFDLNNKINNNSKIEHISIEEGIRVIEDSTEESFGTFSAIGIGEGFNWLENFEFTIELPNTLNYLGAYAFYLNQIYTLNIPSSVKIISNNVIGDQNTKKFLSALTFEENSQLTMIGEEAFNDIEITSLIIPSSVETIGYRAFSDISKLTTLTFKGADNNTSNLKIIGEKAFYNSELNYTNNSLILPSSITDIGNNAFYNLQNNNILFMGTRENLDKLGVDWYNNNVTTVKAYGE